MIEFSGIERGDESGGGAAFPGADLHGDAGAFPVAAGGRVEGVDVAVIHLHPLALDEGELLQVEGGHGLCGGDVVDDACGFEAVPFLGFFLPGDVLEVGFCHAAGEAVPVHGELVDGHAVFVCLAGPEVPLVLVHHALDVWGADDGEHGLCAGAITHPHSGVFVVPAAEVLFAEVALCPFAPATGKFAGGICHDVEAGQELGVSGGAGVHPYIGIHVEDPVGIAGEKFAEHVDLQVFRARVFWGGFGIGPDAEGVAVFFSLSQGWRRRHRSTRRSRSGGCGRRFSAG